jgi:hypothetical protein
MPQQDGNCKQEMLERSGGTVRYRFSCTGEHPTSGEGEYTMTNPSSYTGKASVLTQVKGKPEKIDMTTSGRWVSADCGSIKPRVPNLTADRSGASRRRAAPRRLGTLGGWRWYPSAGCFMSVPQRGEEVADAAAEHEQVPDEVRVAHAMVEQEDHRTNGVAQAPGHQPGQAGG